MRPNRSGIFWLAVFLGMVLTASLWTRFSPRRPDPGWRASHIYRIGWIGVAVEDAEDSYANYGVARAVKVHNVSIGGPADQSGIVTGDVIVRIDGEEFFGREDLQGRVAMKETTDEISLDVVHGSEMSTRRMQMVPFGVIVDFPLSSPGGSINL